MGKKVTLFALDYEGKKICEKTFELDDIVCAFVEVISGDEVVSVIHKNGDREALVAFHAWDVYLDANYDIIKAGKWVVDEEEFQTRKTSSFYMLLWEYV